MIQDIADDQLMLVNGGASFWSTLGNIITSPVSVVVRAVTGNFIFPTKVGDANVAGRGGYPDDGTGGAEGAGGTGGTGG